MNIFRYRVSEELRKLNERKCRDREKMIVIDCCKNDLHHVIIQSEMMPYQKRKPNIYATPIRLDIAHEFGFGIEFNGDNREGYFIIRQNEFGDYEKEWLPKEIFERMYEEIFELY